MTVNSFLLKEALENIVSIVIPSRCIDPLLKISVSEIRKLHPLVPILLILDDILDEELSYLSSDISVIQSDNKCISAKRNLGVKYLNTKYVAFIDSDAYPKTGWLENSISFLENNVSYTAVTGSQLHPPSDSFIQRCLRLVRYSPLFTHKEWLMIVDKHASAQDCKCAVTANMIIRVADYIKLNGMNEQIYLAEDNEFCDRLISSGRRIRFIPSVVVYHRERPLKPFLSHIFSMSSYYANTFKGGLKIKRLSQSIMQFVPLAGVIFFMILCFLFVRLGISTLPLFLLPGFAILVLFVEAVKTSQNLEKRKYEGFIYIFFINILFCATWVLGTLCGFLSFSSLNPYDTYKH